MVVVGRQYEKFQGCVTSSGGSNVGCLLALGCMQAALGEKDALQEM